MTGCFCGSSSMTRRPVFAARPPLRFAKYSLPVTRSPRFAAIAAVAGALWGLALTPPMAAVWAYESAFTRWEDMAWVERTFGPMLVDAGALSFGRPDLDPYEVYGKGFFLVYLAMVPIVRLVHERYRAGGGEGRWELWTWRTMYVALWVAAVGDFASYWGVSLPGPIGESLWGGGFGIELLASAVLLVSTTIYGLLSLRLRVAPIWAAILLIAVIPLAIATLAIVVGYIPNGYAVPLSLMWAAISLWLVRQPQEAPVPA